MQLSDLTKEESDRAVEELYELLSEHVSRVVHALAYERYSIPRERRRIGPQEFPYYFAADLDLLFRFARGEAEASSSHVGRLCRQVVDLLHAAPAGALEPDWDALEATPMGLAIRACEARLKLRDDDSRLSAAEVGLLSGLSPQKIAAARMPKKRRGGVVTYPAPEVRALFEREGVPI